jgi:hypothetical protein
MGKQDELDKFSTRGQIHTEAEADLEGAREAFHADPSDPAAREAFHQAQRVVVAERVASRRAREAEGPPADAAEVIRDATGQIFGWTTAAGDAVSAQGGRQG